MAKRYAKELLEDRGRKDPSGDEIFGYIKNVDFDDPGMTGARIRFKRSPEDELGVTVEDILVIAHSRLYELNSQVPCRENSIALTKIEEAILWLDQRTLDRELRGVEGTKEK